MQLDVAMYNVHNRMSHLSPVCVSIGYCQPIQFAQTKDVDQVCVPLGVIQCDVNPVCVLESNKSLTDDACIHNL